MNTKIGWLDGNFGSTNKLAIPIDDRGLNFGDGIFETIYIEGKTPKLLKAHLKRWARTAHILGMEAPPKEEEVKTILTEMLKQSDLGNKSASARLNWSRGSNLHRGINITKLNDKKGRHKFWIEIVQLKPSFSSVSMMISKQEQRNANSLLSQCKTFNYMQSIQARKEARHSGFDDALLLSTTGEICCGATANIIIKRDGQLLTPRLESGCLPGIMRAQGLSSGTIKEVNLSSKPELSDEWLLINSLSCQPISRINHTSLKLFKNPEKLWRSLLNDTKTK